MSMDEIVYKKRVSTKHPRWRNRTISIMTPKSLDIIPIPDISILCNGCNDNIYDAEQETFGWLIYFSKQDIEKDIPYDVYCDSCVQRRFPKAREVK